MAKVFIILQKYLLVEHNFILGKSNLLQDKTGTT
jgi:hypothetical protein